jgi:hypothetical protein
MASRPGSARALSRTVSDVIDLEGQRRHFLERAAEIASLPPMAIVWGDRDRVLPFRHATDAAQVLEGVPLSRFEGCGHFPHREEPQRFAEEAARFLGAPELRSPRLVRPVRASVGHEPRSIVARAVAATLRAIRRLFGGKPQGEPLALPAPLPATV